jgi:hypothetical protein
MCNSILKLVFRSTVFYYDGKTSAEGEFWLARRGTGEKPEQDGFKKASVVKMTLVFGLSSLGSIRHRVWAKKNININILQVLSKERNIK